MQPTKTEVIPNNAAELAAPPREKTHVQKITSTTRPGNVTPSGVVAAGGPDIEALCHLQWSGLTSNMIADAMRADHILGHRSSLGECPLANWASAKLGMPCEVNEDGIMFTFEDTGGRTRTVHVVATPAMREFVQRFDADQYPDLVA